MAMVVTLILFNIIYPPTRLFRRIIMTEEELQKAIETLWTRTKQFEERYISGSAPALVSDKLSEARYLEKTNTVAMDIKLWQESLWTKYYEGKQELISESKITYDVEDNPPIPHTIPELMASTCE